MPWLCIPWQQAGVRAELAELYGIRGIPTLLLLDSNGHVITMDARTEIADDPLAQVSLLFRVLFQLHFKKIFQNFPWKPRSVNVLTERHVSKLHDYPAIVLFVGKSPDCDPIRGIFIQIINPQILKRPNCNSPKTF